MSSEITEESHAKLDEIIRANGLHETGGSDNHGTLKAYAKLGKLYPVRDGIEVKYHGVTEWAHDSQQVTGVSHPLACLNFRLIIIHASLGEQRTLFGLRASACLSSGWPCWLRSFQLPRGQLPSCVGVFARVLVFAHFLGVKSQKCHDSIWQHLGIKAFLLS